MKFKRVKIIDLNKKPKKKWKNVLFNKNFIFLCSLASMMCRQKCQKRFTNQFFIIKYRFFRLDGEKKKS